MFGFGKKKENKEQEVEPLSDASDQAPLENAGPQMESTGDASLDKIAAKVMKLEIQFQSVTEFRNALNEKLTRFSEQIGELRSMILERDKTFQHVEAQAVKATDLVESVQPDKLMVEVKKIDGKVEALKANIESNESIQNNMMNELKEMRNNMSLFKGADQVTKMNEDMMKEINDMRKLKAIIEKHADKVETMFMETQKNFTQFNGMRSVVEDLQKTVKPVTAELDNLKVKVNETALKREVSELLGKFQEFEKHMSKVVDLLDKRTESAPKEMQAKFSEIEKNFTSKIGEEFKKAQQATQIFKELEEKAPELYKKFGLDKAIPKADVGPVNTVNEDVEEKKQEEQKELEKKNIFETTQTAQKPGLAGQENRAAPQEPQPTPETRAQSSGAQQSQSTTTAPESVPLKQASEAKPESAQPSAAGTASAATSDKSSEQAPATATTENNPQESAGAPAQTQQTQQ